MLERLFLFKGLGDGEKTRKVETLKIFPHQGGMQDVSEGLQRGAPSCAPSPGIPVWRKPQLC